MIELSFIIDEVEDPPSYCLSSIQQSFSKILSDSLFAKFVKKTIVSIVFVNDSTMQNLNFQYRGKNSTTDVLSFPLSEELEGEFLLGEIVVSVDKAKADAKSLGITFEKEVIILLIHGITHLLGFDHNDDQQETEMKEVENKLMNLINLRKVL